MMGRMSDDEGDGGRRGEKRGGRGRREGRRGETRRASGVKEGRRRWRVSVRRGGWRDELDDEDVCSETLEERARATVSAPQRAPQARTEVRGAEACFPLAAWAE